METHTGTFPVQSCRITEVRTSCLTLLFLSESNEFILYAVRNSIHRYDMATGKDQALPLTGLREAVALDFDYDRNCLYWADISLDTIQVSEELQP